jgi:RIO kinase 1
LPRKTTDDSSFHNKFERVIDGWRIRNKDSNDRKTFGEVFDRENLMRVYKLFSDGVIDRLEYPVSTGKEGNVFCARSGDGELLAVKIFRTSTATYKDMAKYVEGDPRFKGLMTNRRKLINAWALKEYRNLERMHEHKVRVPKPVTYNKNMVVMEFIGSEEGPAPMMRNVALEDPEEVSRTLMDYVKVLYTKALLVHGDLSEYNVLMKGDEPVVIDVGQSVLLKHPLAEEMLDRDVANVARYFRKYGLSIDVAEELREIRK